MKLDKYVELIAWCKELLDDDTVELTASAHSQLRKLISSCESEVEQAKGGRA